MKMNLFGASSDQLTSSSLQKLKLQELTKKLESETLVYHEVKNIKDGTFKLLCKLVTDKKDELQLGEEYALFSKRLCALLYYYTCVVHNIPIEETADFSSIDYYDLEPILSKPKAKANDVSFSYWG